MLVIQIYDIIPAKSRAKQRKAHQEEWAKYKKKEENKGIKHKLLDNKKDDSYKI